MTASQILVGVAAIEAVLLVIHFLRELREHRSDCGLVPRR